MLIDKPIDELRVYLGSSPLPEDFNAYWDESLAELAAIPPELELIPSEFQAPGPEVSRRAETLHPPSSPVILISPNTHATFMDTP